MDLLFAVIRCVFMYLQCATEAHFTSPCTGQADGKGCEGSRVQGVGGLADQISAVKKRPRRDSDE
jgi:hypothetical protein